MPKIDLYSSVDAGTPGKLAEMLNRNSPDIDEEMPIKKTNLGIFLEESRNQIDPDALKLLSLSQISVTNDTRRNNALFPLPGQLVQNMQGSPLKIERLANAPMFKVRPPK